jgi:hypothetical protein
MKKLGMSLAVLFAAASFGWAQAAAQAPAEKPATAKAAATAADAKAAKTTTHKLDAEVVSTDVEKKTITVKVDGAEKTAPVGPLAMYRLKKLKAGDKVVLTCKDDAATGEHKEVSFIRMATDATGKASPAPAEKKQ